LTEAARKQKERFDKSHEEPPLFLGVGHLVWLHDESPAEPGQSKKLTPPFAGPYEVVKEAGPLNRVIRHVENPANEQKIHVRRLKPVIGQQKESQNDDGHAIADILEARMHDGKKDGLANGMSGWKRRI
jgi:hypothetical protein